MDRLKFIIGHNLVDLRKREGLTQYDLAEKLNYSDKAVSKWERGESLPDIVILKKIADIFEVSVDYLLTEDHSEYERNYRKVAKRRYVNRVMITLVSLVLVLFVALFAFVNIRMITGGLKYDWTVFLLALPVLCIVWLVFNSVWFNRRLNYLIISLLMWTGLLCIFIYTLSANSAWLLFMLGVPGQIIIILWSRIKPTRKIKRKKHS